MLRTVRRRVFKDVILVYNASISCPPRMFIPVLCKIFLDESAPDHVLEVTARALTYYLDVSADCARRLAAVDGSLQSIVQRVAAVNIESRPSKDLAEQCTKVCIFCLLFFCQIVMFHVLLS